MPGYAPKKESMARRCLPVFQKPRQKELHIRVFIGHGDHILRRPHLQKLFIQLKTPVQEKFIVDPGACNAGTSGGIPHLFRKLLFILRRFLQTAPHSIPVVSPESLNRQRAVMPRLEHPPLKLDELHDTRHNYYVLHAYQKQYR